MQHCNICGRDFWSDTEYEQDQFIHNTEAGMKQNYLMFNQIFTQLAMMNVLTIQKRDKCTFEEAVKLHFNMQDTMFGIVIRLREDRWGK